MSFIGIVPHFSANTKKFVNQNPKGNLEKKNQIISKNSNVSNRPEINGEPISRINNFSKFHFMPNFISSIFLGSFVSKFFNPVKDKIVDKA